MGIVPEFVSVCLVPKEVKRGYQISWNWNYGWL